MASACGSAPESHEILLQVTPYSRVKTRPKKPVFPFSLCQELCFHDAGSGGVCSSACSVSSPLVPLFLLFVVPSIPQQTCPACSHQAWPAPSSPSQLTAASPSSAFAPPASSTQPRSCKAAGKEQKTHSPHPSQWLKGKIYPALSLQP